MSNRDIEILKILLNQKELITRDRIAELLEVSVSTIRNDLFSLNKYLINYGCEITNVRGVGIKIDGDDENLEALRNRILSSSNNTFERHLQIAYVLITNRNGVSTISNLCNQFYLSRVAMVSELKKLQPWFKERKMILEIVKNKGIIQLLGSETDFRNCLSNLIKTQTNILDQNGFLSSYKTIQENIVRLLKINPKPIKDGLLELLKKLRMDYSNNALNTLIMHITISIVRLRQGKDLEDYIVNVEYQEIYDHVNLFCQALSNYYQVSFTKSEISLIYSYLLYSNDLVKKEPVFGNEEYKEIANEIIRLVEDIRGISISSEKILNGLVLHIIPLCNRLKNNVILKNPLIEKIKTEYPDSFGIAWMTNSIFKKRIGKTLNEDEIGYLSIHVEAMLEQADSVIKTVIVCSQGIGISQLLAQKISNRFKQIYISDVISEDELTRFENSEIDLFITTFSIKTKKNFIIVSPLLLEDDVSRINSFIENYPNKSPKLFDVVKLEVCLNIDCDKQAEIFSKVENKLFEKKYVKMGFKQNLELRESKCSTAIGAFTAIPHASPDYVNKSVICVVTMRSPILWGSEEVDVLFVLAIAKSDNASITNKLRSLYKLLYNESFHNDLLKADSLARVLELVNI